MVGQVGEIVKWVRGDQGQRQRQELKHRGHGAAQRKTLRGNYQAVV